MLIPEYENYQESKKHGKDSFPYYHIAETLKPIQAEDVDNDYRLTMSARLLKETEESVLEVAMGVGFDNLSYFNRCFKKKFQITPGKYRKEG